MNREREDDIGTEGERGSWLLGLKIWFLGWDLGECALCVGAPEGFIRAERFKGWLGGSFFTWVHLGGIENLE